MSDLLKHIYFELSLPPSNHYCIRLHCNMGWVYKIKHPEDPTWSQDFLCCGYEVISHEEYS